MRHNRLNLLGKRCRSKASSATCLSLERLRCQGVNRLDFLVTRHYSTVSQGRGDFWGVIKKVRKKFADLKM
jgi:hypothetical protein